MNASALFCTMLLFPGFAFGQIQVLPSEPAVKVFSGEAQKIEIRFKNPTDETVKRFLQTRLYQASSATLMPVTAVQPWKSLTLLPRQSAIETLSLNYPAVRTGTRFLVHWLAEDDQLIGQTEVWVYPEDLLHVLSDFAGLKPLGVLDPENLLKPVLKKAKVEFQDLEAAAGFANWEGKLAIVGPFLSMEKVPSYLPKRVIAKAGERVAIVWLQPPSAGASEPIPSIYPVAAGKGAIIVNRSALLTHLADSPAAQLQLIRCVEVALHPELLQLPTPEH